MVALPVRLDDGLAHCRGQDEHPIAVDHFEHLVNVALLQPLLRMLTKLVADGHKRSLCLRL